MTDLVFAHPSRTTSSFRPLKALRHFRKLVADKEDTEQVFHIIDSLRGRNFFSEARKFWDTPLGKDILARGEYLPDILDDHDRLRKLPKGSLAQHYVDFMEREGLTAAGLVAEYDRFTASRPAYNDLVERYGNRLRDTHDLFHVLTGYGRDAMGEQCLLGFSYSQNPNLGVLFIAYAGAREMKHQVPTSVNLYAAVREGQRLGKAAKRIAQQDVAALLALPLEEVRRMLNIGRPERYFAAHDVFRAEGIDPYNLFVQPA